MRYGLIFLALLALPGGAAQSPAESALAYAAKIQTSPIDLHPGTDTAIHPQVREAKIRSIADRLQRMSARLRGLQLEAGPIHQEGMLAGVLVRAIAGTDPWGQEVIPLAMIQDQGQWLPCPVPASFENTTISYNKTQRHAVAQIENWLAREQVREVERMRESAARQLRSTLAQHIPPSGLRSWTSDDVVERFLKACDEQDTRSLQALCGGLSTLDHAEGEASTLTHIRWAVEKPESAPGVWRSLLAREVLRVPVRNDEVAPGQHRIDLACLDPKLPLDAFQTILTLDLRKETDGLWRFAPPRWEDTDRIRSSMLDRLPTQLLRRYPTSAAPSAQELKHRLIDSLHADKVSSWASLISPSGGPEDIRISCTTAAARWWLGHNPSAPALCSELDFREQEQEAFLAMQWLPLANLAFAPQILHLQKSSIGWLWNPNPSKESRAAADAWSAPLRAAWRQQSIHRATAACAIADLANAAPNESAARHVVEQWLDALAQGRWGQALAHCATLDTPKSPSLLLRNLSYESKNSMQSGRLAIATVHQGAHVTLVAARKADKTLAADLFLPVVSTPLGPRLLLEIDLGDPARPGRAFLNREAIDRLHQICPAAAQDVTQLMSAHAN
jgi:hypothetical protein